MMVWTKNPDLETKMMILIKKSLIIRNGGFDQKFLTREKSVYFEPKLQFFKFDHFWWKMWIFWLEIHKWLNTFIQILSENFRFSSELMIDYTLFVCLYFGITHDFLQLCKFFEIFLENFSSFAEAWRNFWNFLKISPQK